MFFVAGLRWHLPVKSDLKCQAQVYIGHTLIKCEHLRKSRDTLKLPTLPVLTVKTFHWRTDALKWKQSYTIDLLLLRERSFLEVCCRQAIVSNIMLHCGTNSFTVTPIGRRHGSLIKFSYLLILEHTIAITNKLN